MDVWQRYFPQAELPVAVFYSDTLHGAEYPKKPADNQRGYTCLYAQLARVHKGEALAFDPENLGCEVMLTFAFAENERERPRCILGGMDTAMRLCLKPDIQTFSIAYKRFEEMASFADETFLDTYIWQPLRSR